MDNSLAYTIKPINLYEIYQGNKLICSCPTKELAEKLKNLLESDKAPTNVTNDSFWDVSDTSIDSKSINNDFWDKPATNAAAKNNNENFLVIDGSSMLATAYYGTLPKSILYAKTEDEEKLHYSEILHTSKGEYTNAVFTMLKIILKIINEQKPSHVVVAFDKSRDTFRRKLYADYKANRKEKPAPLKEQFILMQEILNAIGIKTLISDEYEADDLAGSVICKFKNEMSMTFMTKDHDYLQLIDNNVNAWMMQTSKENAMLLWDKYGDDKSYIDLNLPDKVMLFSENVVLGEDGVYPDQIVDLKAIAGDSSDNIPGIKGVGPVTATVLLKGYGTLEGIYAAIDECENDDAKEKELVNSWKKFLGIKRSPLKAFKEQRDMAFLCKDLATIRTNVEIPYTLDDFKTNIDLMELKKVLEKYEFGSMFDENGHIGWNQLFE